MKIILNPPSTSPADELFSGTFTKFNYYQRLANYLNTIIVIALRTTRTAHTHISDKVIDSFSETLSLLENLSLNHSSSFKAICYYNLYILTQPNPPLHKLLHLDDPFLDEDSKSDALDLRTNITSASGETKEENPNNHLYLQLALDNFLTHRTARLESKYTALIIMLAYEYHALPFSKRNAGTIYHLYNYFSSPIETNETIFKNLTELYPFYSVHNILDTLHDMELIAASRLLISNVSPNIHERALNKVVNTLKIIDPSSHGFTYPYIYKGLIDYYESQNQLDLAEEKRIECLEILPTVALMPSTPYDADLSINFFKTTLCAHLRDKRSVQAKIESSGSKKIRLENDENELDPKQKEKMPLAKLTIGNKIR